MTIRANYPGVFIEEDKGYSLTVNQGPTAVPILAYTSVTNDDSDPVRVNSWVDFLAIDKALFPQQDPALFESVKYYFLNGGGYCYIAPIGGAAPMSVAISKVEAIIDATLLIAAGSDITVAVEALCTPGSQLFAIMDAGTGSTNLNELCIGDMISSPRTAYYYPWLTSRDSKALIPPSAVVGGVICAVDREAGPWKAPANVVIKGGLSLAHHVHDNEQYLLMAREGGKAINILRDFSGTVRIWGARTTVDPTGVDSDWIYIPARRLVSMVERDIKKILTHFVFEHNGQATWEAVNSVINSYLHNLWSMGGLMGYAQDEAYFVQVGKGSSMTDEDIRQGKLIVNVGLAVMRPAEFICFQCVEEAAAVE